MPPPIPLVPPALFGSNPSLPDLKNPAMAELYWNKGGLYGGLGYHGMGGRSGMLPGLAGLGGLGGLGAPGSDYIRGRGITGLSSGLGDYTDKEKFKKALYRNELLGQMDDNKSRRVEKYHISRYENELEEDRLRRERAVVDSRYAHHGWDINDRRRQVMDNQERVSRNLREQWHRQD